MAVSVPTTLTVTGTVPAALPVPIVVVAIPSSPANAWAGPNHTPATGDENSKFLYCTTLPNRSTAFTPTGANWVPAAALCPAPDTTTMLDAGAAPLLSPKTTYGLVPPLTVALTA